MIGQWAQRFATAIERPLTAYGLAVAAVVIAVVLRDAAGRLMVDPPPFMTFFPAVLFATLAGGVRGGLLAVLLSVAAVTLLFLPPTPPDQIWAEAHTELAMFGAVASLMVLMAKALRLGLQHGAAAEERFRAAQDSALDAFVILEPIRDGAAVVDFRWVYANRAAELTAPAGIDTLVGRRVREVFPDETGEDMMRRLRDLLEQEGPDDVEVRRVIDGAERWMHSSGVRLKQAVAVRYRDVTRQRAAEQALRESETRTRALIDALPQLLWSSPAPGGVDYVNPQWSRHTGLEPEQLFGMGWLETVHPDDRVNVEKAWDRLIAGAPPQALEYRIRRNDGAWRWFSGRVSFVRDEDGTIQRWYGSATDITEIVEARRHLEERVAERTRELEASLEERARAEAQLAQAQRLETVGRLTGGVAHDFNNLLTVIIGGLDMILRRPQDVARVTRLGEAALAAGRRGERLTRQLLAFSRRQELKLELTDVAALIARAEPLIRRAVDEAVDLHVAFEPGVCFSHLDAAQFEAALLNLVVNAADATPPGGAIRVEAARVRLGAGEVNGAAAGDYVRITVSDTGCGMPPEILERVFEPFFTTKEVGKGTGLGLAQVFGFVSQCGGVVTIDSVVDQGSTVRLHLPAAERAGTAPAPDPEAPDTAPRISAKVLLVEDDPAVRTVTESLLAEMGCTVACEAEGASALRRLERGEDFDAILSDIVMPGGMSGVDLARAAATARPEIPVVLTTGYAGERGGPAAIDIEWPILRKPFRADQLATVLREAIERPRGRTDRSAPTSQAAH